MAAPSLIRDGINEAILQHMETPNLTNVEPVQPIAPWQGGKRNLAKRITSILDRRSHEVYAEPFVGMGGIFLRRKCRPRSEIINDYSREIANLFRILQRHYPQFLDVLRFQLTTRTEFERLVRTRPDTLTDLERAGRFLYLQRTAFGGKVSGQHFGVSRERPARFNLTTLEPMLEDLHCRLSGVVIECLDFDSFIRRYDGPKALFYLDPPYWGCEDDYGVELFKREDFKRLAEVLGSLQGQFLMSLNDVPEVREMFGGFFVQAIETTYSLSSGRAQTGRKELLISSWELK